MRLDYTLFYDTMLYYTTRYHALLGHTIVCYCGNQLADASETLVHDKPFYRTRFAVLKPMATVCSVPSWSLTMLVGPLWIWNRLRVCM